MALKGILGQFAWDPVLGQIWGGPVKKNALYFFSLENLLVSRTDKKNSLSLGIAQNLYLEHFLSTFFHSFIFELNKLDKKELKFGHCPKSLFGALVNQFFYSSKFERNKLDCGEHKNQANAQI